MSKKIPSILKQINNYINAPKVFSEGQKTISYSQMSTFLQCPHKWSLNYRDGHRIDTFSINMTFGTALHSTLQNYFHVAYNDSGVKADEIDLEEYFENELKKTYTEEVKKNKGVHFSNRDEMEEFFEDGLEILSFIKKNRTKYFSSRGWWLVGCEVPLIIMPNEQYKNVIFKGYLDMVMYHEPTNQFVIYDFKTSTRGWRDKEKKDEIKQSQLILYKHFFSKQFKVPEDNIEVEFFILKRKIWENSDYPQKRIQQFVPSSGKIKTGKSVRQLNEFIENVFEFEGKYKDTKFTPKPDKYNCKYCPFMNKKELCSSGI
jgi:CRISPR/Cas system-associated exonuclease Cas4 (RecB family)